VRPPATSASHLALAGDGSQPEVYL